MPDLPERYLRAYGPDNPPPPTATVVDTVIRKYIERIIKTAERTIDKHSPSKGQAPDPDA